MRIAIITATPQSVAAGSGTFVATRNLRAGLATLGHDVTIVAPSWSRLPSAYALRRWLFNRRLDPRWYTGADLVLGIDLDGYAIAHRLEPPFVAYIHGQLADEARFERGVTRRSMLLQARWERTAVHRADLVVTGSAYSRRRIVELYGVSGERVAVVPPGFDAAGWTAQVEAASPDSLPAAPIILAVARLYPRKNLGALIAAARDLKARRIGARFRIVGNGPERRTLERLVRRYRVEDVVELAGYVSDEALPAEFARAAVFCLPSLQEGFGIVFVQAMAAALPVVACRATSTPEVVTDGVHGLLVSPEDNGALADAIESLLHDDATRSRMALAGCGHAAQYTLERSARQLLDAAQALVHRGA